MEILTAERDLSGREGLWRGALKENKHTQARRKGEIDRIYGEKNTVGENACTYEGDNKTERQIETKISITC